MSFVLCVNNFCSEDSERQRNKLPLLYQNDDVFFHFDPTSQTVKDTCVVESKFIVTNMDQYFKKSVAHICAAFQTDALLNNFI
ncbi:unnamed protein product [Larinioides sclopetarius]|uniref:Uncharacterized protein n=1 Tax=Larinioides sclopetarius TaxID=280406 RepID=A0AAV2B351_9ARAC